MQERLNYAKAAPDLFRAVLNFNQKVNESGLEASLLHLVKYRASQINGCAFCLDMHSKEALADGETAQRLYVMAAWRESPVFSSRERAALAWTEAVTRVAEGDVDDALYAEVREQFSEEEIAKLTMAIGVINVWNRLSVAFRAQHETEDRAA
ncbi:carboxymuconolactone decarboxylase family protein [Cucumibacter marinus]|uniref:carboxymuconolactone decarboxylase family protein n=1 Tax=Cucumibacter marinus TaxID=1121252 RepID=UPI00040A3745|nr:carboxymuconolactone decarboxylase family protein [Cucumibacter marinus]